MSNLTSLQYHTPGSIVGEFRLRDCCLKEARNGRQYLQIHLEDMSCSVPAYIWKDDIDQRFYLPDHSLARIEGQSRYHRNLLRVDLKRIELISQIQAGDVVRLIPKSVCPLPELLITLQAAINQITIPVLRHFAEAVLANDSIAFAFVSVPASLSHHHCYPGGLLRHSLECFYIVKNQKGFSRENYELRLISSLFHDIGKVVTMTHDMQRTSLGSSTEDDKRTFELLGPYLSKLEHSWPAGAKELRYLLKWKIRRKVPEYNIADLGACSDRLSAGFDMDQKQLQKEDDYERIQ